MGKTVLKKFTAVLVTLAFLLQIASIASPGWLIVIHGNIETGRSLFYKRICHVLADVSTCETKSCSEMYTQKREALIKHRVSQATVAELDHVYNTTICRQTLTTIAVALSLVGVLVQAVFFIKRNEEYVKLRIFSTVLATLSAGIILTVVCYELVENKYQHQLKSFDADTDNSYIGFPYCLAMLVGSVLLLLLADVSTASILFKPKPVVKRRVYDDDTSTPTTKVAPDEFDTPMYTDVKPVSTPVPVSKPTPPVPAPAVAKPKVTTDNEKVGQDNPVFSEKL